MEQARPSTLHDPRFRSLFSAIAVSQLGDRVSELAFPLIAVLVLNASAAQVSVLTALVWVPNLASILTGAWVDRQVRKKRLLVVADLARAVVLLSVPAALLVGRVTLTQLYVVALLTGTASVLFNSAYSSFFVLLVDRADYLDANAKISGARSVSYVAGPALGGGLVQVLGAPMAVLADALSFVVSAVLTARIGATRDPEPPPEDAPPARLWGDARDGLRFLLGDRVLRGSLGCCTTINYFTFFSAALIVVLAARTLHLPSGLIGLALGVGALGGVLGALVAPRVAARLGVGRSVALGCVVFPASIAVAATAGGPLWARVGLLGLSEVVGGFGAVLFDVNLNSVTATMIPDHLRSRVFGAFAAVNYGSRPLGAVSGGALATWLGLRPTLLVAAVGGALSVVWLLTSPIAAVHTLEDLPVG